jgi:hypothetical protein
VAYKIASIVRTASFWAMIAVGLGIAIKAPTNQPQAMSFLSSAGWSYIPGTQGWFSDRPWIIPLLLAIWTTSGRVRDHFGAPTFWALVNGMLTRFRDEAFRGKRSLAPLHEDRMTLFLHKKGRLKPVSRAGDGAKCKTHFRAQTGADPDSVASAVYLFGNVIPLYNLPDLTVDSPQQIIDDYAAQSFADPAWIVERLKNGKQCSRAFLGIPVEIHHKVAGVLLIDSLEPTLPNPQACMHKFQSLSTALGLLLESGLQ